MPRTRRGAGGPSKRINYNEDSENSSEEECTDILAAFALMKYLTSRKRPRKSAGRPRKNNCSAGETLFDSFAHTHTICTLISDCRW